MGIDEVLTQWCLLPVQKPLVSLFYQLPFPCWKMTNSCVVFRTLEEEGHSCRNVI